MALFRVGIQCPYTNSTHTTGFGNSSEKIRNRSRVCPLPSGIAAKLKAVSLHTRPAVKGVFQRKQHIVFSSQSFAVGAFDRHILHHGCQFRPFQDPLIDVITTAFLAMAFANLDESGHLF
jgi:hypothetical protein